MAANESQNEDLWPAAFERPKFKAPAVILREQAALLRERTEGVVQGEVKAVSWKTTQRLGFAFDIVAPFLNNYRLRVVTIAHEPTKVYPTWIAALLMPKVDESYQVFQVANEQEFRARLREIFADETTQSAIESLWVQSEGGPSPPDDDEIPF